MGNLFSFSLLLALLALSSSIEARLAPTQAPLDPISSNEEFQTFDVKDHGAVGDGITDDTQAFDATWNANATWNAACNGNFSSTIHIPKSHSFLLQPIRFEGPCTFAVNVLIEGNLVTPGDLSKWNCDVDNCENWIVFYKLDSLSIFGPGIIDGGGSSWWSLASKKERNGPTALVIEHCQNVKINGLNFVDSPQVHLNIDSSTGVEISEISITAPSDSPHTDGIHIGRSQNIQIHDSFIGTGDDCISIGHGTSHIIIDDIKCGPGHGISIGSLGKKRNEDTVEFVNVKNAKFNGTSNGVRIKTWQGGRGYARNIVLEDIQVYDVKYRIIIDQYYCDSKKQCSNHTSAVSISNITYSRIWGKSRTSVAVKLSCSKTVPCNEISANNIKIDSMKDDETTLSTCFNVFGTSSDVYPTIPCLRYI